MTQKSEDKQNIIFVVKDFQSFLSHRIDLAKYLASRGLRVSLVTDLQGAKVDLLKLGLHRVQHLPFSSTKRAPWQLVIPTIRFASLLFRNKNAVVFSVTIPAVIIAGFFCRILGVRQVVLFAGLGNAFHGQPSFARRALKFCIKLITRKPRTSVIAQNSAIRDHLLANGFARSVTLIQGSGIDESSFQPPTPRVLNDPPKILFLGRILREKGVIEFIEAAKLVLRSGLHAEFILAGRTDSLNPTSLTENEVHFLLENETKIKWIGQAVSIRELLATVDIVCLPSYHEGLPRSLLEAALMGCCLVATDIPGSNDIVISEKTGILVKPKSKDSLAASFAALIKNPSKIENYSHQGRMHVLSNFTNRKILPKYFAAIKEF
jgi:glycosyltransferase involved in cell wall biosynthesis